MNFPKRPYLVIPKLIEQPTWGGTYILSSKNWSNTKDTGNKKIGQSYELFGKSKFRIDLDDSSNPSHIPEVGNPNNDRIDLDSFKLKEKVQYVGLESITAIPMPILIKLTQAAGNSFQIHVKPGTISAKWKPKPETWYYFEDGMATCGLADDVNIQQYRKCCEEINDFMIDLSEQIKNGELPLDKAKTMAKDFIHKQNPWQYVNTIHVKKGEVVDMSPGGIHHSWEENKEKYPLGNVLYEVQVDEMDPVSTLRSFDQGKIKDDGSIRALQLEDYFKFIDTDPEHNKKNNNTSSPTGNKLVTTPFYSLDRIVVSSRTSQTTEYSFAHFYVQSGTLKVTAPDGSVTVTSGHSCFIPQEVGSYEIENIGEPCTVLKTYI